MRKIFLLHFIIIILCLSTFQCKKAEPNNTTYSENSKKNTDGGTAYTWDKKENVRKSGNIELEVKSTKQTKNKLIDIVSDLNGQILNEYINTNYDRSVYSRYYIKIQSESFSVFIEKISDLGNVLKLNLQAEDLSDNIVNKNDDIDLLKARLYKLEKANNQKEIERINNKILQLQNEMNSSASEIKEITRYSYLTLEIKENTKISTAFTLGYYFGLNILVTLLKGLIIVLIVVIPFIIIILLFIIIYKFIKWRWISFIKFIEESGKKSK